MHSIKYTWCLAVLQKKRNISTFQFRAGHTSSNLLKGQQCRRSSGSGWAPPVRMWRLLPTRGQAPLRAQHHLLLPLGLIYWEHLQESVMGKRGSARWQPQHAASSLLPGACQLLHKQRKKKFFLPAEVGCRPGSPRPYVFWLWCDAVWLGIWLI